MSKCKIIKREKGNEIQIKVEKCSEQLKVLMHFAEFAKQEYGLHIPLNLIKEYVKTSSV